MISNCFAKMAERGAAPRFVDRAAHRHLYIARPGLYTENVRSPVALGLLNLTEANGSLTSGDR